ncbi:MAG: hypothetical protein MUC31_01900 [Bacteroidales bacterium]|jgi:hypothetical protein|nr:hypothetical protein [Bacteroidales bacterium]
MKQVVFFLLFSMVASVSLSQVITANKPATLQAYATKPDGTQAGMVCESLTIIYDGLNMSGELLLNTLQTDELLLRNLLDSAGTDRLTFSGMIPEGQFEFHDVLQSKFVVETELYFGEWQSKILIDYEISNSKNSVANTFNITFSGSISLRNNLGVTRDVGLADRISFQLFQVVQTKTF